MKQDHTISYNKKRYYTSILKGNNFHIGWKKIKPSDIFAYKRQV